MNGYKTRECIQEISPKLGEHVANFEALSNRGIVRLDDYKGKWLIFLSHPADFSSSWVNEIERFARFYDDFKKLNCELIGLASENDHSPLTWPKSVQEQFNEEIWFPVIIDAHHDIVRSLGAKVQGDDAAGDSRAIYIIDDHQILRSIVNYDPANLDTMIEVTRLVKLLQRTTACGMVALDNWRLGDEWILAETAKETRNDGERCEMWYF